MTKKFTDQPRRATTTKAQALGLSMLLLAAVALAFGTSSSGAQSGVGTWAGHPRDEPWPEPRFGAAMAFDGKQTLMFGGKAGDELGGQLLGDTWIWNGSEWREDVRPAGQVAAPPARYDAAMTFDGQRILLFGGMTVEDNIETAAGDTWTWKLEEGWKRIEKASDVNWPGPRSQAAMAFHAGLGKVVLFGGADTKPLNDTWSWDAATGWHREADVPSARNDAAMAYDGGKLVLFGGTSLEGDLDETWTWNGTWAAAQPGSKPGPRRHHAMAFDDRTGKVVLFGGNGLSSDGGPTTTCAAPPCPIPGTPLEQTWLWDGRTWESVDPDEIPPARTGRSMAASPSPDGSAPPRAILFGGSSPDGAGVKAFDETYTWLGTPPPGNATTTTSSSSTTTTSLPPPGSGGPRVTRVNPPTGSTAGGEVVSIVGTRFAGATAVNFGPDHALDCTAAGVCEVSDGEITVTTPAHEAGMVHVQVRTPAGLSPTVDTSSESSRFTFFDPVAPVEQDPFDAEAIAFTSGSPDQFAIPGGFGEVPASALLPSPSAAPVGAGAVAPPPPVAPVAAAAFLPTAAPPPGAPVAGFPPESGPMPRPAPWFHMVGFSGEAGAAGAALAAGGGLFLLFCVQHVRRRPSDIEAAMVEAADGRPGRPHPQRAG